MVERRPALRVSGPPAYLADRVAYRDRPSRAALGRALARWAEPVARPAVGVANARAASGPHVTEALGRLSAEMAVTPLVAGRRLPDELARARVLVSGGVPLTADLLDQLDCRVLLRPYVGHEDIDVAAATERGILVCTIPDAYSVEVATHAVAMLLAGHRRLVHLDREVREGRWRQRLASGEIGMRHPAAETVGVVGLGRIGRLVVERVRALGFAVLAHDPYLDEDGLPPNASLVPLDHLLKAADHVTLHASLWRGSWHLIDGDRLAVMKPGARLVNTGRGELVDTPALVAALRSGRLVGAALDVLETEPIPDGDALLDVPDVLLTPHAAVYSSEGMHRTARRAVDIVAGALDGRLPPREVAVDTGLHDALAGAGVPRSIVDLPKT